MMQTPVTLPALRGRPFDRIPAAFKIRSFGLDYVRMHECDGGILYVTSFGWPLLENLLPGRWYTDGVFSRFGTRLPGGTGSVYRVSTVSHRQRRADLVVKFSRFAQEVPLFADGTSVSLTDDQYANARFNGPFEEFGRLMELRTSVRGPAGLRIRTKLPLAIYEPAEEYELWRTGRSMGRFIAYQPPDAAAVSSPGPFIHPPPGDAGPLDAEPVPLNIMHDYVLLFGWVEGQDAEQLFEQGLLSAEEFATIMPRVTRELELKGFEMLDNKPKHVILRRRRDGSLMRRHGQLVYTLVDYELLVPLERGDA